MGQVPTQIQSPIRLNFGPTIYTRYAALLPKTAAIPGYPLYGLIRYRKNNSSSITMYLLYQSLQKLFFEAFRMRGLIHDSCRRADSGEQ
jgi:hypothetical protein